jgi:subtilisin family serine protease
LKLELTRSRAIWADDWMEELKQMQEKRKQNQWLPESGQNKERPRIKIAVLDTGVDTSHNFIKGAKKRIIVLPSYVKDDSSTRDSYGHGTHVAKLLLTVAPEAQLFVSRSQKVARFPQTTKSPM